MKNILNLSLSKIVLILTTFCLLASLGYGYAVKSDVIEVRNTLITIVAQLDFTLKDGVLKIADSPLIFHPNLNEIIVIDTDDILQGDMLERYERGLVVNSDKITDKQNSIETNILYFKDLDFDISQEQILTWYNQHVSQFNFYFWLFFGLGSLFILMGKLIIGTILTVLLVLTCYFFKMEVSFNNVFKMVLLSTALWILPQYCLSWLFPFFLIGVISLLAILTLSLVFVKKQIKVNV